MWVSAHAVRGLPVRISGSFETSNPHSPRAQLAVAMLALFGKMERTYAAERASRPGGGICQRARYWTDFRRY